MNVFFALRGVIFPNIHQKNKEGVPAIRAIKYVAEKHSRARAPLARKNTNRVFESNDDTTSMKIVN